MPIFTIYPRDWRYSHESKPQLLKNLKSSGGKQKLKKQIYAMSDGDKHHEKISL